jgi:hypothetical protein
MFLIVKTPIFSKTQRKNSGKKIQSIFLAKESISNIFQIPSSSENGAVIFLHIKPIHSTKYYMMFCMFSNPPRILRNPSTNHIYLLKNYTHTYTLTCMLLEIPLRYSRLYDPSLDNIYIFMYISK